MSEMAGADVQQVQAEHIAQLRAERDRCREDRAFKHRQVERLAGRADALEAENDRLRDVLEQIVAPYRSLRPHSWPLGVTEAFCLLDRRDAIVMHERRDPA
jgi:hypothetical protein